MFFVTVDLHCGIEFPGVYVHPILTFFWEGDRERNNVTRDLVRHILGQLLLIHPILMESGHEVCEWSGHLELYLQSLWGENECVLMSERDETKESGGLGWSPLSRGAVWQRHHHGLKVFADDLEFAHRLELHGLPCKIFLGRDGVCKDVQ